MKLIIIYFIDNYFSNKTNSSLRDKNGRLISDDEFYKNIRAGSIEKGTMSQAHSKEMRNKYGDELEKRFKGKSFAHRASDIAKKDVESFAGIADADAKHSGREFMITLFMEKIVKSNQHRKKYKKRVEQVKQQISKQKQLDLILIN